MDGANADFEEAIIGQTIGFFKQILASNPSRALPAILLYCGQKIKPAEVLFSHQICHIKKPH